MHGTARSCRRALSLAVALILTLGATTVQAYDHQRWWSNGKYYTLRRSNVTVTYRVNLNSLVQWTADNAPVDDPMPCFLSLYQAVLEGFEAWEQVPYSNISFDVSPLGTNVSTFTKNNANEVFFGTSPSGTFTQDAVWFPTSGPDIGKISEGDARLWLYSTIDFSDGIEGKTGKNLVWSMDSEGTYPDPDPLRSDAMRMAGRIIGLHSSTTGPDLYVGTAETAIMHPQSSMNQLSLAQDDVASVSTLYTQSSVVVGLGPALYSVELSDIRGTIKKPSGQVVNSAKVVAYNLDSGKSVMSMLSGRVQVNWANSVPLPCATPNYSVSGTGAYKFSCLPPGKYAIFVIKTAESNPTFQQTWPTMVTVQKGQTLTLDITVP